MPTTQSVPLPSMEAKGVAKKKKPGRPKGDPKKALYVEIPAPLRDALDKAVKQERRPLATVISILLEKYLEELDLWPPSQAEPEE